MSRKTLSSVSILMLAGSYVSLASAEAPNGISITPSTITKWADGFGDLTNSVIYEDPNTGQVGIGTSTPDGNLTVEGGTVTVNGNRPIFNGTGIQLFNRAGGNTNKWVLGTGGAMVAPDGFSIGDTNAYRFVILGNGNVGINTIAPGARLHVNGAADGVGVYGTGSWGVYGVSSAPGGSGVVGSANIGPAPYGVWGYSSIGYAGLFSGRVGVTGRFDSPDKHFKIDHPLDPANKYMVRLGGKRRADEHLQWNGDSRRLRRGDRHTS